MEAAYNQALELTEDKTYPLANALVAKALRLLRSGDPEGTKEALPGLAELAKQAASLAELDKLHSPDDFWAATGVTDVKLIDLLLKYLRAGSKDFNDEMFDDLAREYKTTWRRYGSARELNSVIGHYAFLAAALKGIEAHKNLSGVLDKTLSDLHSIT
jgi:hypothetical protein